MAVVGTNSLFISLIFFLLTAKTFRRIVLKSRQCREKKEVVLPSGEEEIQIPIEFILSTQTVPAYQYTASQLEAV